MLNRTRAPEKRGRWTDENRAELLRLRDVERLSWFEIDSHFGRMHGSSSHLYRRLKAIGAHAQQQAGVGSKKRCGAPAGGHPAWSAADMAFAEERWRELFVNVYGKNPSRNVRYPVFEIMGRELNRSASAIENRLRLYGASFGQNPASKPLALPLEVSQATIEARERYAARLRQNPCAQLLGDPPPGYSALDQRRAATDPRRIANNRVEPSITLAARVEL